MNGSILVAALLLSQAPAPRAYVIDPAKSVIQFHLDHALHHVDGEVRAIEAKAIVEDGQVRAMARIPVARMQTGDANRDANMRAVLESDRYPYVVLRATSAVALPSSYPASLPLQVTGELDLHGVKQTVEVPLQLAFDQGGEAHLTGSFDVSLEAHHIERPALLFKKVDDACKVKVDLLLRPEAR
jgi:polyisoprenoid-binding protein YceI